VSEWAIALRKSGSRRIVLVTGDMEEIDPDDPHFERDVHVVPCYPDGSEYRFGVHDFERTCYCHPEIRHRDYGRTLVIHSERVN
jgi:hypothetical protein